MLRHAWFGYYPMFWDKLALPISALVYRLSPRGYNKLASAEKLFSSDISAYVEPVLYSESDSDSLLSSTQITTLFYSLMFSAWNHERSHKTCSWHFPLPTALASNYTGSTGLSWRRRFCWSCRPASYWGALVVNTLLKLELDVSQFPSFLVESHMVHY